MGEAVRTIARIDGKKPTKWSENYIAAKLATGFFNRQYLVVVPNCTWPGSECDLLVITENLRVIDVEIKVSRADVKADAKKDKWKRYARFDFDAKKRVPSANREWPARCWKHYYCVPSDIWSDDLFDSLPSKASGVLIIHDDEYGVHIGCRRRAKPDRTADRLTPDAAVNIARLASLRMWKKILEDNDNG